MIAKFQNRKRFLKHQNRIFYRAQNLNRFIQFYSHLMNKYRSAANRRKKWSGELVFLYPLLFLKSLANQKISGLNTYIQQVNQQTIENSLISQKLNIHEKSSHVNFQPVFISMIWQQFKNLPKIQSSSISLINKHIIRSESIQSVHPADQYQKLEAKKTNSIDSMLHHSQNFRSVVFRPTDDIKRRSIFNNIEFEYARMMPPIAADGAPSSIGKPQTPYRASLKPDAEKIKRPKQAMETIQRQEVMDVHRMADQVYRLIQKKIQIENERRGRWY